MKRLLFVFLLGCSDLSVEPPKLEPPPVSSTRALLLKVDELNDALKVFYSDGGQLNFIAVIEIDSATNAPVLQFGLTIPQDANLRPDR